MKDIIKGIALNVSGAGVVSVFLILDENVDVIRACVVPVIVFLVLFSFIIVVQETNMDDTDSQ